MIEKSKGYTIMEIMISILVISAMASLAIPRFTTTMEVYRSKEGVMALNQLLQGMLLSNVDVIEGRIATYSLATIDVQIPNMDHFTNPPVLDYDGVTFTPVTINSVGYNPYAHVARSNGAYTLYILADGRILCDTQVICTRMNYDPW